MLHSLCHVRTICGLISISLILLTADSLPAQLNLGGAIGANFGGGSFGGLRVGGNTLSNSSFADGRVRSALQQFSRQAEPTRSLMLRNNAPPQPQCQQPPAYSQPVYTDPVYTTPVYTGPVHQPPSQAVSSQSNQALTTSLPAAATAVDELQQARTLVAQAKQYFARGQYSQAQPKLEELVALVAQDSNAHQFRSFVHFAREDYDAAAADAYDALLVGNTWDWQTVYELYGQDVQTYQKQLRRLELAAQQNQTEPSMSVHFLLGYQYLVLGHLQRGQKELEKVLQIQPEEELVTQLVNVVASLQSQP